MNTFRTKLASALKLRESGKHEEARQLLVELHAESSHDPQINDGSLLPCAWIHDLLALEREAILFYEKAIQTGLSDDELKSALLGMGSTYGCVGEYQKSIETFQQALTWFPNSHEFNVFPAMAYYNIGEHSTAMELSLNSLVNPS